MLTRETKVMRSGQTFVGRYRVTGNGDATSVMVQFRTAVICARKGSLSEERVAETLLGELVQEALAGDGKGRCH